MFCLSANDWVCQEALTTTTFYIHLRNFQLEPYQFPHAIVKPCLWSQSIVQHVWKNKWLGGPLGSLCPEAATVYKGMNLHAFANYTNEKKRDTIWKIWHKYVKLPFFLWYLTTTNGDFHSCVKCPVATTDCSGHLLSLSPGFFSELMAPWGAQANLWTTLMVHFFQEQGLFDHATNTHDFTKFVLPWNGATPWFYQFRWLRPIFSSLGLSEISLPQIHVLITIFPDSHTMGVKWCKSTIFRKHQIKLLVLYPMDDICCTVRVYPCIELLTLVTSAKNNRFTLYKHRLVLYHFRPFSPIMLDWCNWHGSISWQMPMNLWLIPISHGHPSQDIILYHLLA